MSADIWANWDAALAPPAPLIAAPAALPDAETIPPREWLYGTRLIRRYVSVLVAPGGVGKSAYALAVAVAVATGKPILNERVHHPAPAWVLNLEDPLEELDRRLAALLRRHDVARDAVAGRLFLHSGRDRRIRMGEPAADSAGIAHPDKEAIVNAALASGIGLIVVDPFVKSHALDENANPQMDAAATAWAEVADATGAAVLLVHHVRKATAGAPVDIDAARGADAQWFRLDSVALGNGSVDYPNGDQVAALAPWKPESVWARLPIADCRRAATLIGKGPNGNAAAGGVRYTASRGRGTDRWAGHVLVNQFGLTAGQASTVISTWLREGVLQEADYLDRTQRKTRTGLIAHPERLPDLPFASFQGSNE